jgi:ammonium transporter, Amt family
MRQRVLSALALCGLWSATAVTTVQAQVRDQDLVAEIAELRSQIDDATLAGNNAWMLVSSALVLFMTAPGLAMFYGGLVRRKNVLSIIMQCIFLMGLMTMLWGVIGYSLAAAAPTWGTSTTCS